MTSGAFAISCANPFDLVKVRLQSDVANSLIGLPVRYKNARDALRSIVKTEGVPALWTGILPNIYRNAVVNATELATFDTVSQNLKGKIESSFIINLIGGMGAGLLSIIVGCPIDIVKTRMMNQWVIDGKPQEYMNMRHCFVKILMSEGILSF